MPAKKGHKKVGGRQKGTVNKRTKEVLDSVQKAIDMIQDSYLESDIKKLSESERLRFYTNLLEFVRPKLARTDLTTNGKDINTSAEIIVLSQEEADLIKRIDEETNI